MNEKQLQSTIVLSFTNHAPEDMNCLWSVRNTTFSQRDGQTQVAMGMRKGVADLNYFKDGRFIGIEIKVKGEKHDSKHIANQYRWGKKIEDNEGEYYIVTSIQSFWAVIDQEFECEGVYTLQMIADLLNKGKSTIVF